jgi:hypothetical protein
VGGIVLGGVFGGLASSAASAQKSDCASPTACTNHAGAISEHSSAQTDAVVSTVGFIAGGALVAGGVLLFLLDRHPAQPATGVTVVPTVGPGSGGLWMTARF